MYKQRDQASRTDQFDRDHTVFPGSGGVDSEGDKIPLIRIDRAGRHIGEVLAAVMRAVCRQKAEDANLHPVYASLRPTSSKDHDSDEAAVVKHPRSGGDRAETTKVVP